MPYKYNEYNFNRFESHQIVFDLIKENAAVLDVGCATGYFAKAILKKNCVTFGIDYDKNAVKKAAKYCKETAVIDLNEMEQLPFKKHYFDYILLMDVLEHLNDPESIILKIKPYLKKKGKIIISVPNIAHASTRLMLLKGNFTYTNKGIMDKTHLKFFTQKSLVGMLRSTKCKIKKIIPTNGMTKVPFLYKITDRLPVSWQYKIVCRFPRLFAYQFVVSAEKS